MRVQATNRVGNFTAESVGGGAGKVETIGTLGAVKWRRPLLSRCQTIRSAATTACHAYQSLRIPFSSRNARAESAVLCTEFVGCEPQTRPSALVATLHGVHLAAMRGEFVDLGVTRLYYYAAGTRGAGEPVDFPARVSRVIAPLAWRRARDARRPPPGRRRSARIRPQRPAAALATLTAPAHADRVRLLMDELHIDAACVVGHGMGGAVAQALALNAPARVTRLCLVNSTAFDAWPSGAARARAAASPRSRRSAARSARRCSPASCTVAPERIRRRENGRHALDTFLRAYTMRLGVDASCRSCARCDDPTRARTRRAARRHHAADIDCLGRAGSVAGSGRWRAAARCDSAARRSK